MTTFTPEPAASPERVAAFASMTTWSELMKKRDTAKSQLGWAQNDFDEDPSDQNLRILKSRQRILDKIQARYEEAETDWKKAMEIAGMLRRFT